MTKQNDKTDGVTFLAPDAAPPAAATRATYTRWQTVREQLAQNPGVWAIVLETQEGDPGFNSVHGKKKALAKKYPEIEAEVRTENGVRRLYARSVSA
jgi:hypothetical protein